jgi:hypothetical protein
VSGEKIEICVLSSVSTVEILSTKILSRSRDDFDLSLSRLHRVFLVNEQKINCENDFCAH